MTFKTADVACVITDDGRYVLTAPLVYAGRDETFTVPAGFRTDLGSVPRCLTWLVPVAGIWDRATIVHDALCEDLADCWRASREGEAKFRAGGVGTVYEPLASAVDTDGILRRICRELGVPLVRRWLVWTAVRWGALVNPARRSGWLSTAPAVVGISLLALPVIAPATVLVVLTLAVDAAVEAIAGRWSR